ncbi:MAG: flagellar hook-basal body complex protein [Planctomycetota bacterium]
MGLSQALFSAISGLTNHQRRMDNIGNNLANVNTVGFKKGVHQFATLLSQTLRGGTAPSDTRGGINPISVGLGTNTSSVNQDFSQGSLQTTGNQRDMAVEGNGFFVLRTGLEGVWGYAYTRDGTFYLGTDGKLLGGEGLAVQGISAEDGAIPSVVNVSDLVIPIGKTGAAQETTRVGMTGNLNSTVDIATPNSITTATTFPTTATGATWLTTSGNTINVGHVETSAALWDITANHLYDTNADNVGDLWDIDGDGVADGTLIDTDLDLIADSVDIDGDAVADYAMIDTGAPVGYDAVDFDGDGNPDGGQAVSTTDLANLMYLRGNTLIRPFLGVSNGDEITIAYRKGGRKMTATFTYDDGLLGSPDYDGTTIQDLSIFLAGALGDDSTTERLSGGAMGSIHTSEKTQAVDGYDVVAEHGGAYWRQYDSTHAQAVDYTGRGATDDTVRLSLASNLGTENAITDIQVSFNNVTYTDLFSADADYGTVEGGSNAANMIFYDSLGNPKDVTMQITLVGRDSNFSTWRWVADSADDTDATWLFNTYNDSASPTTSINVGTGTIRFDSEGRFVRGSELSETAGIEISLDNQGVNYPLRVQLIEGLATTLDQDLNFATLTQVAAASDFNLKEQNGSPPGTLDTFTVTSDGIINGVYSNGVLEVLGQIVLAKVPNPQGLIPTGANQYIEGANSGEPQIAAAGTGGRGLIRAGSLELSNVDLSEEFTNLIVTQRGFQASTRVVSTADEMLVELVNLKR